METHSWHTPEYVHRKRSTDWYWTVGIITGALAITAIIFGNALFAVVLLIGAFALAMFSARKPNVVHVTIDGKGARVDKVLYPYSTLESFSMDTEHHDGPRLHFKSKKALMPLISIPVKTNDLEGLHIFLSKHLKEEEFEEGVIQALFDRIGF